MKRIFVALVSLALSLPLFAADGFSSLEEQMSGPEFSAAGLDKLSRAELDALNSWIRRRSVATLDTPRAGTTATVADTESATNDTRGLKQSKEKGDRTPITSRIVGSFKGWDGQTVFKLENGMIWAQADKDKFYTKEVENPVVIIEPGMFGTWHLHLEGRGSECRVKRLQ